MEIVVKKYKQHTLQVQQALNDEFTALSLLNASFAGQCISGWAVSAPEPYLRSEDPPALLMSFVPGRQLEQIIGRNEFGSRKVSMAVASSLATLLGKFWKDYSRIIGDVNYRNILCDLPLKRISIIDPGMPSDLYLCRSASTNFSPASRDLGYLLFDVCATNTKFRLVRRGLASRRLSFARKLIVQWAVGHIQKRQYERFIRELYMCGITHTWSIPISCYPRGIWRRWVRFNTTMELQKATHEIGRELGMLHSKRIF